jgi:hypothetical protein
MQKEIVKTEGEGQLETPTINLEVLTRPTPKENIRQRKGKGGMTFSYVEVGYVIKTLNDAFSPLNWDFKVVKNLQSATEVIVQGELTVKDHKGSTVTKTQFGCADVKTNVPVGDIYKAATSDALKKCASLLGLALDVYAPNLEMTEPMITPEQSKKIFAQMNELGKEKKWIEEVALKQPIKSLTKEQATAWIDVFEKKIAEKPPAQEPVDPDMESLGQGAEEY